MIKSQSTASARLFHTHTPRTDNDSSLPFAALGKAEPLITAAVRPKFAVDKNGLGGRALTDRRTDRQTDRQTDATKRIISRLR